MATVKQTLDKRYIAGSDLLALLMSLFPGQATFRIDVNHPPFPIVEELAAVYRGSAMLVHILHMKLT
jgi:hypothetical protein